MRNDSVRIAVSVRVRSLQDSLGGHLAALGCTMHSPREFAAWAGDGTNAAALLSLSSDQDVDDLARLHRRCPQLRLVALLDPDPTPGCWAAAAGSGATGAVSLQQPLREIAVTLQAVAFGSAGFPADAVTALTASSSHRAVLPALTGEELRILNEVRAGATAATVSRRLGITDRTLRTRQKALVKRFGARSWADLLYLAGLWGLGEAPLHARRRWRGPAEAQEHGRVRPPEGALAIGR